MNIDAVAVRFQLLPDVIDFSSVLSFSGAGGLLASLLAASLRFEPDRMARLVVLAISPARRWDPAWCCSWRSV